MPYGAFFWEQAVTEAERAELRSVALGFVQHVCGREEALWARFHANLARAEAAMAEAIEEPFVKGSTGQLVEHPGFKVAARCDDLALRLYAKLTEDRTDYWGISRLRADDYASVTRVAGAACRLRSRSGRRGSGGPSARSARGGRRRQALRAT